MKQLPNETEGHLLPVQPSRPRGPLQDRCVYVVHAASANERNSTSELQGTSAHGTDHLRQQPLLGLP
jgi:hypothetical protein